MKIFISWSGQVSKSVGLALHEWLPIVLQHVEPWLSEVDIQAGEHWPVRIAKELEDCEFGIICLTKENVTAPWIFFEAGALSRSFTGGAVCPYLFDIDYAALPAPLAQFQAKLATKESTAELVGAINKASGQPIPQSRLSPVFDNLWPQLERKLAQISKGQPGKDSPRDTLLEQLITRVRRIDQKLDEVLVVLDNMGGSAAHELGGIADKVNSPEIRQMDNKLDEILVVLDSKSELGSSKSGDVDDEADSAGTSSGRQGW